MASAERSTGRPDGVVLAAAWFVVAAALALIGVAAILAFGYAAVLDDATTGAAHSLAIGGVSFGLVVVVAFGAANVVGAMGLLGLRPWGRVWAITLAAVSLLLFPVGTVAGGLIIGYLLTDEAKVAFTPSQRFVLAPRVRIDLRDEPSHVKPFSTSSVARMSRYRSRSARLPHLGEEAKLVLPSFESLRPHG